MPRLLALLIAALLVAPGVAAAAPSIADAPVRVVKAEGQRIGYRSIGSGRPLVLIMGLSGSMEAWPPSFVDRLAARRRVIAFDNAGIGRTGLGSRPLTIARMADDAAALIRRLRLGRADVLGWSMGGMIAQSLASRHPARVRRMVLAATAPGDGRATLPDLDVLGRTSDPSGASAFGLLFPDGREAELGARYARQLAAYPTPQPRAPAAVSALQFSACAVWLLGREPSGRRPERLRLPVLVGAGALDEVLPVANQRHLAAVLPKARLALYPDAAHGFFLQHTASFARRVNRFLGRRR
jgi:pimeloyl-ACP methyl ester carboxylesterase